MDSQREERHRERLKGAGEGQGSQSESESESERDWIHRGRQTDSRWRPSARELGEMHD